MPGAPSEKAWKQYFTSFCASLSWSSVKGACDIELLLDRCGERQGLSWLLPVLDICGAKTGSGNCCALPVICESLEGCLSLGRDNQLRISFLEFLFNTANLPRKCRCPILKLTGQDDSSATSLDWSLDPSYYMFAKCECEEGPVYFGKGLQPNTASKATFWLATHCSNLSSICKDFERTFGVLACRVPQLIKSSSGSEEDHSKWIEDYPWVVVVVVFVGCGLLVALSFVLYLYKGKALMRKLRNLKKRAHGLPKSGPFTVVVTDIQGWTENIVIQGLKEAEPGFHKVIEHMPKIAQFETLNNLIMETCVPSLGVAHLSVPVNPKLSFDHLTLQHLALFLKKYAESVVLQPYALSTQSCQSLEPLCAEHPELSMKVLSIHNSILRKAQCGFQTSRVLPSANSIWCTRSGLLQADPLPYMRSKEFKQQHAQHHT
eukprot:1153917-Pelagomonas_calceolata.AAC.4